MFDVFDILVPVLASNSGLEVRQFKTAFGPSDDKFVYSGDLKFAQLVFAKDVYSDVEAWAGSFERTNWTVLVAANQANEAVESDETWKKFLGVLESVLRDQRNWLVICESDCDQYPVEKLKLSPEDLIVLLNECRVNRRYPIAIKVSVS